MKSPDPPPTVRRRLAARRVRGYLVLGPVPPLRAWWPAAVRLVLAALLPFWIYTPLLVGWLFLIDLDQTIGMSLLFGGAAFSLAAGLYPLATWPCRWPFRLAATLVWATLLGLMGYPWSILVAEYLGS